MSHPNNQSFKEMVAGIEAFGLIDINNNTVPKTYLTIKGSAYCFRIIGPDDKQPLLVLEIPVQRLRFDKFDHFVNCAISNTLIGFAQRSKFILVPKNRITIESLVPTDRESFISLVVDILHFARVIKSEDRLIGLYYGLRKKSIARMILADLQRNLAA